MQVAHPLSLRLLLCKMGPVHRGRPAHKEGVRLPFRDDDCLPSPGPKNQKETAGPCATVSNQTPHRGVLGRPSSYRPPAPPSHTPSLPGPRAPDRRPEQGTWGTREGKGAGPGSPPPHTGRPGIWLQSQALLLNCSSSLPRLGWFEPKSNTFNVTLRENTRDGGQQKTSGTNVLDPSAPAGAAGACRAGWQEEGQITHKNGVTAVYCLSEDL